MLRLAQSGAGGQGFCRPDPLSNDRRARYTPHPFVGSLGSLWWVFGDKWAGASSFGLFSEGGDFEVNHFQLFFGFVSFSL